jgi:23S rRNA (cytidine1920-2'-O)/16S rRNA (cytidine1409-2'-O)-methyltransferase
VEPMRADKYLVENGYFETRAKAQAAIAAGTVRVDGEVWTKASRAIRAGAHVQAEAAHPWVSRAALKLIAGLDAFGIDPAGRICLDVGSSTGGFTQVLLERGAARVISVDVGRDQLDAKLRADPRVLSLESQDARTLTLERIGGEAPGLVVCDASFISLEKVLATPLDLARPGADLIALFKPQFEVGRAHVGKGGIVKDEAAIAHAKENARAFLARAKFDASGTVESPITGGDGNREWLFSARKSA